MMYIYPLIKTVLETKLAYHVKPLNVSWTKKRPTHWPALFENTI